MSEGDPRPSAPRRRRLRPASSGQAATRAGLHTTGPALEACYRFLLWLVPTLEKFPRSQKFLLGDRLQAQALAVLDHLIAATYLPRERSRHLQGANLALEQMRFGLRLAKDLKHLNFAGYEHASRELDEVGRLVGGWLKASVPAPAATSASPAAHGDTQSSSNTLHATQTPAPF